MTGPSAGCLLELGYLGFTAPNVDQWIEFATGVIGVQHVESPNQRHEAAYFRMDERSWRFFVEPGVGGLAVAGWEVDPARLDDLRARLAWADVDVQEDPELAHQRRVERLVRCVDPFGNRLELFCGSYVPRAPFVSPHGVTFVSGALGLGHILFVVPDEAAALRFYVDLLGFRISDTIALDAGTMLFTHLNARHHSLAFGQVDGAGVGLNHFLLEVDSLDAVGRALDRAEAAGAQLVQRLGKHSNDHMTSFYVRTPSGFELEYGCHGRTIEPASWRVQHYDDTSIWGHGRVESLFDLAADDSASPTDTNGGR